MPLNLEDKARIEQLLKNWWLARNRGGGSIGLGMGSGGGQWRNVAAVPSARCNIPVLIGEAERTEKAMNLLPTFERVILVEAHFSLETVEAKAKKRRMHRKTYWEWVTKAEEAFWHHWQQETWNHSHAVAVTVAKAGDTSAPEFEKNAPWNKPKPIKKRNRRARNQSLSCLETQ